MPTFTRTRRDLESTSSPKKKRGSEHDEKEPDAGKQKTKASASDVYAAIGRQQILDQAEKRAAESNPYLKGGILDRKQLQDDQKLVNGFVYDQLGASDLDKAIDDKTISEDEKYRRIRDAIDVTAAGYLAGLEPGDPRIKEAVGGIADGRIPPGRALEDVRNGLVNAGLDDQFGAARPLNVPGLVAEGERERRRGNFKRAGDLFEQALDASRHGGINSPNFRLKRIGEVMGGLRPKGEMSSVAGKFKPTPEPGTDPDGPGPGAKSDRAPETDPGSMPDAGNEPGAPWENSSPSDPRSGKSSDPSSAAKPGGDAGQPSPSSAGSRAGVAGGDAADPASEPAPTTGQEAVPGTGSNSMPGQQPGASTNTPTDESAKGERSPASQPDSQSEIDSETSSGAQRDDTPHGGRRFINNTKKDNGDGTVTVVSHFSDGSTRTATYRNGTGEKVGETIDTASSSEEGGQSKDDEETDEKEESEASQSEEDSQSSEETTPSDDQTSEEQSKRPRGDESQMSAKEKRERFLAFMASGGIRRSGADPTSSTPVPEDVGIGSIDRSHPVTDWKDKVLGGDNRGESRAPRNDAILPTGRVDKGDVDPHPLEGGFRPEDTDPRPQPSPLLNDG